MQRMCSQCEASYDITVEDVAFYDAVSPVIAGKKYPIPAPEMCPNCRSVRRMVWRNERSLYNRPCALCKKTIVCMYHADLPYNVLCEQCWPSDRWDAMQFGRAYEDGTLFWEQFDALLKAVAHRGLFITGRPENSDYTNWAGPCKDCYLVFNSGLLQDCYYSKGLIESKDCMDMSTCQNCEWCYECINASNCYNATHCQNCSQCQDSTFLFNCVGCDHCIGCTNLTHASYCIFNEKVSKEEYDRQSASLLGAGSFSKHEGLRERFAELVTKAIHRERQSVNTENSTGDFLFNTKNCRLCFEVFKAEDCAYLDCSKRCKSSQDLYGYGYDSELLYQCTGVGYSFNVLFSVQCERCSDSMYCFQCTDCKNCFGCVGLRKHEYCILNKQYTKEEYEALASAIIGSMQADNSWGKFLPSSISPFGYNETVALEYFPGTKGDLVVRGWKWSEHETLSPQVAKIIEAMQLPDSIEEIPDDITEWAIRCRVTGKPFRIIRKELEFYRRMQLPIPRLHPDERHRKRLAMRNPRHLWDRSCAKCGNAIQTTYSPERPEVVYCEECYLKEVY